MSLWLVGMMGSGKSAVGSRLAARLGVPFVDIDTEVAVASGRSISRMWEEDGEDAFREREREVMARVAGRTAVVATGGGAPIDRANRDLMRASGKVVWLEASVDVIAGRLGPAPDRPMLAAAADTRAAIAHLLEERRPFYESVSDLSVDTVGHDVDAIADQLASWSVAAGFPDD